MGEQIFSNFGHLLFPTDARREEGGLGLTNKTSSNLTRPPALSGCSRDVNTFFHLRIKKVIFRPNDFSLFPHKYINIRSTIISSRCITSGGEMFGRRIENRFNEGGFGFRSFSASLSSVKWMRAASNIQP